MAARGWVSLSQWVPVQRNPVVPVPLWDVASPFGIRFTAGAVDFTNFMFLRITYPSPARFRRSSREVLAPGPMPRSSL